MKNTYSYNSENIPEVKDNINLQTKKEYAMCQEFRHRPIREKLPTVRENQRYSTVCVVMRDAEISV